MPSRFRSRCSNRLGLRGVLGLRSRGRERADARGRSPAHRSGAIAWMSSSQKAMKNQGLAARCPPPGPGWYVARECQVPGHARTVEWAHMDEQTARAVEDYDRLLRDEKAHAQELQANLADRLRAAKLTFGGRLLCPFLRPNFVSPAAYEQIRDGLPRTSSRPWKGGGRARAGPLGPRGPDAARSASWWPSTPATRAARPARASTRSSRPPRTSSSSSTRRARPASPTARCSRRSSWSCRSMQRFQEKWTLRRFQARQRLLRDAARTATARRAGSQEHPTIAIVDYEDVPTRTEHHLFREFFADSGYPAAGVRPARPHLREGRAALRGPLDRHRLQAAARQRADRARGQAAGAHLRAARDRAVTVVNPFRCKPIHKKAIFAVLTDDEPAAAVQPAAERRPSPPTCPGRAACAEGKDTRDGRDGGPAARSSARTASTWC